jgi:hypothetical protein
MDDYEKEKYEKEFTFSNNTKADDDRKANIGKNEYGGTFKCLHRQDPCYGSWLYLCKHNEYCQLKTFKGQKMPPL